MMPLRHIPLMLLGLLALPVLAEQSCDTPAQCNQEGTAAYQAGRFEAAIESFERQLRRVENEDEAGLGSRSTARRPSVSLRASWSATLCRCAWRMPR